MAGLNLTGANTKISQTFVAPAAPPSASGTSATALAFGGAQMTQSNAGRNGTFGGVGLGVVSLVLLVLVWHSLPR
jgi:hypothetical protein